MVGHFEMIKKILLIMLLGHAFSAMATPNSDLALRMEATLSMSTDRMIASGAPRSLPSQQLANRQVKAPYLGLKLSRDLSDEWGSGNIGEGKYALFSGQQQALEQVQSQVILEAGATEATSLKLTNFANQSVEQPIISLEENDWVAILGLVLLMLLLGLSYYLRTKASQVIKSSACTAPEAAVEEVLAEPIHSPETLVPLVVSTFRDETKEIAVQQCESEKVANFATTADKVDTSTAQSRSSKVVEILQEKYGYPRPVPQLDNFLADFDSQRIGSVNEFLTARNAVTLEQLISWSTNQPSNRPNALRLVGA
jgi:hypothetical protein